MSIATAHALSLLLGAALAALAVRTVRLERQVSDLALEVRLLRGSTEPDTPREAVPAHAPDRGQARRAVAGAMAWLRGRGEWYAAGIAGAAAAAAVAAWLGPAGIGQLDRASAASAWIVATVGLAAALGLVATRGGTRGRPAGMASAGAATAVAVGMPAALSLGAWPAGASVLLAAGWALLAIAAGPGMPPVGLAGLLLALTLVGVAASGPLAPALALSGSGSLPATLVTWGSLLLSAAIAGTAAALHNRSWRRRRPAWWRRLRLFPDHVLAASLGLGFAIAGATLAQASTGSEVTLSEAASRAPASVAIMLGMLGVVAIAVLVPLGIRHRRPDLGRHGVLAGTLLVSTAVLLPATPPLARTAIPVLAILVLGRLGWRRGRARHWGRRAVAVLAVLAIGTALVVVPPALLLTSGSTTAGDVLPIVPIVAGLATTWAWALRQRPLRRWQPAARRLRWATAVATGYLALQLAVAIT